MIAFAILIVILLLLIYGIQSLPCSATSSAGIRYLPLSVAGFVSDRIIRRGYSPFNGVYFDNNGTSPPVCVPRIDMGNLSALYADKSGAAATLKEFESLIHSWCSTNSSEWNIIVTSGASESINSFLHGVGGREKHVVMSAVEHKTSFCCDDITQVRPLLPLGPVVVDSILDAIKPKTRIVSVMSGNNETGIINDVAGIAARVRAVRPDIWIHSDMVQTFGKYKPDLTNIDAVSVSFHKFGGTVGTGMLMMRKIVPFVPQIVGTQNGGLRGGTENMAGIYAAVCAMRSVFPDRPLKNSALRAKRDYIIENLTRKYTRIDLRSSLSVAEMDDTTLMTRLVSPDNTATGFSILSADDGLPGTILVSFIMLPKRVEDVPLVIKSHFCNIRLRRELEARDIHVSIGSTCNTSVKGASHVLLAYGLPFVVRCGVVRISLGDQNSYLDCDVLCTAMDEIISVGCVK